MHRGTVPFVAVRWWSI